VYSFTNVVCLHTCACIVHSRSALLVPVATDSGDLWGVIVAWNKASNSSSSSATTAAGSPSKRKHSAPVFTAVDAAVAAAMGRIAIADETRYTHCSL
jgi:hypothetical protein